jgi:hypothetical protein
MNVPFDLSIRGRSDAGRVCAVALAVLALVLGREAQAAQYGGSAVTFNIQQISEITFTGSPTLTITGAVAGQEPQPVTDNTSRYAISTNGANLKITAQINKPMPPYTTLEIMLAAPGSGASMGFVPLSTTPAAVVTGIGPVASGSRAVTYRFSATTQAGVISDTFTVTLTLTE